MIIDSLLEFSDAQALTATAASTNTIDLGSDRDIGNGRTLWLVVSVDVATDGTTGDETYQVDLYTDGTNDPVGAGSSILTFTIPRSTAAGTKYVHAIPNANERYLELNYTLGGTTPTATLSAWLTDQEPESWAALPDSANIA